MLQESSLSPDQPPTSSSSGLRSEEVQDIISAVPAWIIRWGTTLFFALLLLLLGTSWLIHYPDIVEAPFRLTARNAPKSIRARTEGKLIKLFAQDNALVKQNAVLAYLESTANHKQVLTLARQLDTLSEWIQQGKIGRINQVFSQEFNSLGELQPAHQTFHQAHTELLAFLANGFYLNKRKILQEELMELMRLEDNLKEQLNIYHRDFQIAQQEFSVQQQLAQERVIAPIELKREESKLLARQLPLKQVESAIVNNHVAQHAKRKELLEADKLISEERSHFIQSLNTLRSEVEGWKQKYILSAPTDGRVYFSAILEENQPVVAGQEVFFVAPPSQDYYGELRVPQHNMGKVEIGQRALIKFAGYPYQEFGAVEGKINFISALPDANGHFLAKVTFPKGLKTNSGKHIIYRSGMKATGEIVTEDVRLLERFFYQFKKAAQDR